MGYLDNAGLTYLWSKIKATFATKSVATGSADGLMSSTDKNKVDSLKAVATSGAYSDLTGKPTIPTDATVGGWGYIKSESDPVFTASPAHGITAANITSWNGKGTYSKPSGGIPKTDLDSAVQTSLGRADTALQSFTETDPTVPSWAKAASKPTYTASEVGALPDSTVIPPEVTESTVSGWGFTKNTGTVTKVNNVSPVNGNVTISIPTVTNTYSSTSNNAMSGKAVAQAIAEAASKGVEFMGTLTWFILRQEGITVDTYPNWTFESFIDEFGAEKGEFFLVDARYIELHGNTIVGQTCEVGDMIFTIEDSSSYSDDVFNVVQNNIDTMSAADIDVAIASVS